MPHPITPPKLHDLEVFLNGALLIDKPKDWTSFDVCGKLRGKLTFLKHNTKRFKVGHAGTLDPMATGLLIVCTGKGTKSCDAFMAMSKSYSGTIRLGEGTDTYDAEGEVSERLPWEHITDDALADAAATFVGELQQVPPMHSAIKINGRKLYDLARKGVEVERQARAVSVSRFVLSRDSEAPQDVHFEVDCSKGTYVRSLAHDLGAALGTCAHLTALRREAIGEYHVRDAWALPALLDELSAARDAQEPASSRPSDDSGTPTGGPS